MTIGRMLAERKKHYYDICSVMTHGTHMSLSWYYLWQNWFCYSLFTPVDCK